MPCTLQESQVLVWTMLECSKKKKTRTLIRQVKPDETESDSTTISCYMQTLSYSSTPDSMEQQNNIKEMADVFSSFTVVDGVGQLSRHYHFYRSGVVGYWCLQFLDPSSPPTFPDCVVVGFTRLHVYIHFVSQEPSWRRYDLDSASDDIYSFPIPTFFNGRDMYVLCKNEKVEAFRNMGEEDFFRVVVVDKVPRRSCCTSPTDYFLSNCDQQLLLVIVDVLGESVEVFKLNDSTKEWEKIDGLGKYMIYFSDASCICLEPKSSEMENKIYFPSSLHNEDTKIVFYSLETCRTMSLSLMPCTLQESQVLVWTMLECRLEVDQLVSKEEEKDKDIETVIRRVKPDETESDSTTSESHLLNVPFHILEMITECCVGVEYMKFRATCKRCRIAAPRIQWSNKTTLRRWQMYSVASPWLMVLDNYRGIITFIDPVCGDKYFIKKPRELNGDCKICYSMYGWLLMRTIPRSQLCFFNPFTSNILKLPAMPCCLGSLCFSAPPTSPDCMVVGFTSLHVYIHFVSQEPSWSRYDLDTGSDDLHSFPIPTLSGRDMYVLCNNERIEAFRNLGEEDFSRVVAVDKGPISSCTSLTEYFLLKCDQHLLLVIVGEVEESVEVFKLNDSTKEWEKIDGLGKHMIYISYPSCFCLESKSPEMENKIYFPRTLHNEDTKIVFYSLETCKYHTFDDKNIQESVGVYLSETKRYCHHHTWIEPSWS
ncbi:hypothetical protein L1987_00462 [Smallanthus sonchifolius]|uniref:Uncharacterized protein n=1 Tax=Smallanthus sonchifolius TaxID=185202 RepID=A0ACB9K2L1_9ASTR|nr:hypothetical protein L1987_00462 [Smallanthus sonchifolius]